MLPIRVLTLLMNPVLVYSCGRTAAVGVRTTVNPPTTTEITSLTTPTESSETTSTTPTTTTTTTPTTTTTTTPSTTTTTAPSTTTTTTSTTTTTTTSTTTTTTTTPGCDSCKNDQVQLIHDPKDPLLSPLPTAENGDLDAGCVTLVITCPILKKVVVEEMEIDIEDPLTPTSVTLVCNNDGQWTYTSNGMTTVVTQAYCALA